MRLLRTLLAGSSLLLLAGGMTTRGAGESGGPAGEQETADRLAAEYKQLPPLLLKYKYQAIAGPDYALYTYYLKTLIEKSGRYRYRHPVKLQTVAAGQALARVDVEFAGTPSDYLLGLVPDKTLTPGDLDFGFDSTVLYDGTSYLLRTNPGKYVSLQGGLQSPIAGYLDVVGALPVYIPDQVMPIPPESSINYPDLIAQLLKDKTATVKRGDNGITLAGLVRRHPDGVEGEEAACQVSVSVGLVDRTPFIKTVQFHGVLFRNGGVVTEFPGSTITFSDYVSIHGAMLPKMISATCTSSLFGFNGDSPATNAQRLGLAEKDLEGRSFAVITHQYSCSEIDELPPTAQPALVLSKGETVLNRFDGQSIHVPKEWQVTNIGEFVKAAKPFTDYHFRPSQ